MKKPFQTLPVVPLYGDMHINVYLCPRDQRFTSYELDPGKWTCVNKDVVKVGGGFCLVVTAYIVLLLPNNKVLSRNNKVLSRNNKVLSRSTKSQKTCNVTPSISVVPS